MKMLAFAQRNLKEILRDPINIFFGLGFPVVLLLLLSAIQANVPVALFEIQHLAPGITVFGLAFLTLFSATLIAKDRGSAFLQRLYTTPMGPADFILGYMLPILPMAMAQSVICYGAAVALGLAPSVNILLGVLFTLPISLLYIGLGLLCGSVLNDKQVGGICGALLTNLSAWFSGVWFDLELVGGTFRRIANLLPFVHGAELEKALFRGDFSEAGAHILPIVIYSAVVTAVAVACFLRQMKKQ